jgi:predicted GIY-YIG superfamily endonuclease
MATVHKKDTRDTYKYHLIRGNKILHRGITTDLDRRLREHHQEFPRAKIKQIGRRTTREKALEWERRGGKWWPT